MKRLCLFAGYSNTNTIEDYVIYYIRHIAQHSDVYYLGDNDLAESELRKLDQLVKGRWAYKHGKYDFGSWQEMICKLGWSELERYDLLILVNDSNYGPIHKFSKLFEVMDQKQLDFWGITKNNGVSILIWRLFLQLL